MSSKRWKQIESVFAKCFGTERVPLSGGNSKISRSDSMHPRLFIEVKQRSNSAVVNLFEKTVELAKLERKIPLLGIHKKNSRLWLVVCDMKDLVKIASEYKGSNDGTDKLGQDGELGT